MLLDPGMKQASHHLLLHLRFQESQEEYEIRLLSSKTTGQRSNDHHLLFLGVYL